MASGPETPVLREERKVVTALFADLVGSTAIGAQFDPEDAREIIAGAIAQMIEAIERFGGTVKDLAGDGLLALFGAPAAHEDDVERAVLAGLEITGAMPAYADSVARQWGHEGLGVRIGIETGPAVVGPVGAGGRVEYGAVGDVVNTAARLQAAARPGDVLVGEVARREIADRFGWGPPARHTLKGKDEPVVAAVAVRAQGTEHRRPIRADAPFVGRADELAEMDERLSALAGGHGSAVVLTGEPGIGKSRYVAEARRHALAGRYGGAITWLEGGCVSWADGIPYGLYRDVLARWLGISPEAPADQVARALTTLAGSIPMFDATDVSLLGLVLAAGRFDPEAEPADAEAIRAQVFEAVVALFHGLTAVRPLVVSLEDVHWADPTSLALTERLIGSVVEMPMLVLITRRPSAVQSSAVLDAAIEGLGADAASIVLPPLAEPEHERLLDSILGGAVPDEVRRTILETTEGNPFFLEEQVRSLEESGRFVPDRRDGRRFVESGTPEIPRTVERVLVARIDGLTADEKDVLVAASVLGREFDLILLERLTDDRPDLRDTLDRLATRDLIRSERDAVHTRFRFKHALIHEAAYRTLLKRRRRELHRRAADTIRSLYEGRLDHVAGPLGRHLHEAGEPQLAVPHLVSAGDRARGAFANEEALSWYERAVDAVREIPDRVDGDGWAGEEADLHDRRGMVLELTGRFEEARSAYRRALAVVPSEERVKVARIRTNAASVEISDHRYEEALAELDRAEEALGASRAPPGDPEAIAVWLDVQDERMGVFYWTGDLEAYTELIDRVRPIVESKGTPLQRVAFFDSLLTYRMRLERYVLSAETVDVARAALEAAEKLGDEMRAAWSRFELGFALVWAGRPDEAVEVLGASKIDADRMGDVVLRSRSLTYLLVAERLRGDPAAAERAIDPVIECARAASLPEYEAIAIANRSWVRARDGRDADAEVDARASVELLRSLPIQYPFEWMALWPLLGVELRRGRTAEAIACARDMLDERQQPLPADLRANLETAVEEWEGGRTQAAKQELRSAIHLARRSAFV